MKPFRLPLIVLAIATTAMAEDPNVIGKVTTLRGKTYEDVKVSSVEPDGIRVTHKDGAAKLPFNLLPEEFRLKFGFDETKAREFQVAKDAKQQQDAETQRASRQDAMAQQKENAFQSERKGFLDRILSGGDLSRLKLEMEYSLSTYKATGETAWVKMLEEDIQMLNKHIASTSAADLAMRNKQLRDEISGLRNDLRSARSRSYSYTDPFNSYYNPRTYIVPQKVYVPYCPSTVPHAPTPAPLVQSGNLVGDIRLR